ncbi:hypothetical protein SRHO_G00076800 [Serrasalmus rhombeus]
MSCIISCESLTTSSCQCLIKSPESSAEQKQLLPEQKDHNEDALDFNDAPLHPPLPRCTHGSSGSKAKQQRKASINDWKKDLYD